MQTEVSELMHKIIFFLLFQLSSWHQGSSLFPEMDDSKVATGNVHLCIRKLVPDTILAFQKSNF